MSSVNLEIIQRELKKQWDLKYTWGRKQNDLWDKKSNFIYEIPEWEELLRKIEEVNSENSMDAVEFLNYSCNRWYNFWSAKAVEKIFTDIPGIHPHNNSKDRLVDFTFFGIDFDLKTAVFPKGYSKTYSYAKTHEEELIQWLYDNQSVQQRQHFSNRLFLVVYAKDQQHWKLKAEVIWLKGIIEKYVATFKVSHLKTMHFSSGTMAYSDIIWAVK